jgi:hypothetical protein
MINNLSILDSQQHILQENHFLILIIELFLGQRGINRMFG